MPFTYLSCCLKNLITVLAVVHTVFAMPLHIRLDYICVHLGSTYVGVPKLFLDKPQVVTAGFVKFAGISVSETVYRIMGR
ncbi:MAG: hypothetical protein WAK60_02825 [Sedimentisphaerales bacterium]